MTNPRICICGCGAELVGKATKFASSVCAKRVQRARWIKKTYGISMEDYERILEEQGNVCAICDREFRKTPHVDHEHGGHVRGIVCSFCNTRLIGRLKDHQKAQRLADYLREPPAERALGRKVIAPGRPPKKRQPRKRPRK